MKKKCCHAVRLRNWRFLSRYKRHVAFAQWHAGQIKRPWLMPTYLVYAWRRCISSTEILTATFTVSPWLFKDKMGIRLSSWKSDSEVDSTKPVRTEKSRQHDPSSCWKPQATSCRMSPKRLKPQVVAVRVVGGGGAFLFLSFAAISFFPFSLWAPRCISAYSLRIKK